MPLARTNRGQALLSFATQTTASAATPSFTPAVGSLLVVLFNEVTSNSASALTVTSTGFTIGSVTQYSSSKVNDGFGSYVVSRAAVCEVTGSAAGTLVINRSAGNYSMGMCADVVEVSGQAASPVRQDVNNTGAGSTLALNFASAPSSGSYLFGTTVEGGGGSQAVPSGWTGYTAQTISFRALSGEQLGSGAQNNTWTGFNNFLCTGVQVEIDEALGQPTIKRLGGLPFAPGRNVGSTVRRF